MLSLFKAIVWKSPAAPAAKPLAASVWRSERIARFKKGIETLRREVEEEEDYTGVGVPRQYPGKPRCIPAPLTVTHAEESEDDDYNGVGVPVQKPRGPCVIYDPLIHGPTCP